MLTSDELQRFGRIEPDDAARCDLSTPCEPWHGRMRNDGYGELGWHGRPVAVHRVVYSLATGIPLADLAGVQVRHLCHNKACRNPVHLARGDAQANQDDRNKARRAGIMPPKSKPLTDRQVLSIRMLVIKGHRLFGVGPVARLLGLDAQNVRNAARLKNRPYLPRVDVLQADPAQWHITPHLDAMQAKEEAEYE